MPNIYLTLEELNAAVPHPGDLPSTRTGVVHTMLEARLGRDVTHAEFESICLQTAVHMAIGTGVVNQS